LSNVQEDIEECGSDVCDVYVSKMCKYLIYNYMVIVKVHVSKKRTKVENERSSGICKLFVNFVTKTCIHFLRNLFG